MEDSLLGVTRVDGSPELEIVVIDAELGFDRPTGCALTRGVMLCASVCATAGRSHLSAAMRG